MVRSSRNETTPAGGAETGFSAYRTFVKHACVWLCALSAVALPTIVADDVPSLRGDEDVRLTDFRVGSVVGSVCLVSIGIAVWWKRREAAPVGRDSSSKPPLHAFALQIRNPPRDVAAAEEHFRSMFHAAATIFLGVSTKPPTVGFVLFPTLRKRSEAFRAHRAPWCDRVQMGNPEDPAGILLDRCPDPSDIVWGSYAAGATQRRLRTALGAYVLGPLIFGATFLVQLAAQPFPILVGAMNNAANVLVPVVIKLVTDSVEMHETKSSAEASLFTKITLFRILNEWILLLAGTPWGELYGADFGVRLLASVVASLTIGNMLRVSLTLLFPRWFGEWHMADRFSDVFQTVAMCMFFGPLVPMLYPLAAIQLAAIWRIDDELHRRWWNEAPSWTPAQTLQSARRLITLLVLGHLGACLGYAVGWGVSGATLDRAWWVGAFAGGCAILVGVFVCWKILASTGSQSLRSLVFGEDDLHGFLSHTHNVGPGRSFVGRALSIQASNEALVLLSMDLRHPSLEARVAWRPMPSSSS